MIAADLRRGGSPSGNGDPDGVDWQTWIYIQTVATFTALLQSRPKWCLSTDQSTPPVVDVDSWSGDKTGDKTEEAAAVWQEFDRLLREFRAGGAAVRASTASEAVSGGQPTE